MNDLVKLAKEHLGKNQNARHDWLIAWRDLVAATSGLTVEDPRYKPIFAALDSCDAAFAADDWGLFQIAQQEVLRAMGGTNVGNLSS